MFVPSDLSLPKLIAISRKTTMANTRLPWEIIVDILSRLPVKDLLRYRCVSKPWCSLIDGPDFIKLHLDHSKQTDSNLAAVLFDDDNLFRVDLHTLGAAAKLHNPIPDRCFVEVLGSCNGLLALSDFCCNEVVICNPSIRRYRKLPVSNVGVSSIVDFHGFGHDIVSDDYKLVRITYFQQPHGHSFGFASEVKVYSLKANSWKRINQEFPYILNSRTQFGPFACNALHWVFSKELESDCFEGILAFDLATEECREVPQPEYKKDGTFEISLGTLGDSLCLLCNYWSEISWPVKGCVDLLFRVDVWVMKEFGVYESWTKLFTLKPSDSISCFSNVVPVAYLKGGDQVLLHQDGKRFVTYDLRRERAEKVTVSGLPKRFKTHSYVGSLVGLNGDWNKAGDSSRKKEDQKQGFYVKQRPKIRGRLNWH